MIQLSILAFTPLLRSRQSRPDETFQSLHGADSVHHVRGLAFLVLKAVFVDGLIGLKLCLRRRVHEGREEVGDGEDGVCAFKRVDQCLSVVEICSDHLDTLIGESPGCLAIRITSDATNVPAWFRENRGYDRGALGASCADHDDELG